MKGNENISFNPFQVVNTFILLHSFKRLWFQANKYDNLGGKYLPFTVISNGNRTELSAGHKEKSIAFREVNTETVLHETDSRNAVVTDWIV